MSATVIVIIALSATIFVAVTILVYCKAKEARNEKRDQQILEAQEALQEQYGDENKDIATPLNVPEGEAQENMTTL